MIQSNAKLFVLYYKFPTNLNRVHYTSTPCDKWPFAPVASATFANKTDTTLVTNE